MFPYLVPYLVKSQLYNGRFQLKFWAQTWISLKFSIVLSSNESIGPVQKKKIFEFWEKKFYIHFD